MLCGSCWCRNTYSRVLVKDSLPQTVTKNTVFRERTRAKTSWFTALEAAARNQHAEKLHTSWMTRKYFRIVFSAEFSHGLHDPVWSTGQWLCPPCSLQNTVCNFIQIIYPHLKDKGLIWRRPHSVYKKNKPSVTQWPLFEADGGIRPSPSWA